MKKRLLSLALCLVMAFTIMPSIALAATPPGDPRSVYAETDDARTPRRAMQSVVRSPRFCTDFASGKDQ